MLYIADLKRTAANLHPMTDEPVAEMVAAALKGTSQKMRLPCSVL